MTQQAQDAFALFVCAVAGLSIIAGLIYARQWSQSDAREAALSTAARTVAKTRRARKKLAGIASDIKRRSENF